MPQSHYYSTAAAVAWTAPGYILGFGSKQMIIGLKKGVLHFLCGVFSRGFSRLYKQIVVLLISLPTENNL